MTLMRDDVDLQLSGNGDREDKDDFRHIQDIQLEFAHLLDVG